MDSVIGNKDIPIPWVTSFDSGTEHSRRALFDEDQINRIYQDVAPAIVSVSSLVRRGSRDGPSSASGVIISANGHVLTNNHVLEGAGGQIAVVLADGERVPATRLGSDPGNDLAVIKVEVSTEPLSVAP